MQHEVIIIGAGPSGIACSVQLKRSGISPLVFERDRTGGLLYEANLVENYPGFPEGIPGKRLATLMKEQFEREGISTVNGNVRKVEFANGRFTVISGKVPYIAETLVISSGTKPKMLKGIPGSGLICYDTRNMNGLSNRTIVIVGAGDLAFDYAMRFGRRNHVIILNRSGTAKCIRLLLERSDGLKRFDHHKHTTLLAAERKSDGRLRLKCRQSKQRTEIEADFVIGAIGREQDTDFLGDSVIRELRKLRRSKRLFLTGDVVNGIHRQTSIAVGDGVKAAMIISSKLRNTNWRS